MSAAGSLLAGLARWPVLAGLLLLGGTSAVAGQTPAELFKQAQDKLARQDADGAIADATSLIEQDGEVSESYALRAYARHMKGDCEGAIADYSRAIDLMWQVPHADKAAAKSQLAHLYLNRAKARQDRQAWADAIEDYTTTLRVDPHETNALYSRGACRQALRDLDGATADFETLIRIAPDKPEGYQGRALIRSGRRDFRGAIQDFRKVMSIEPRYVTYSHLFVWGLRSRLGEQTAADQELADYFAAPRADVQKGDWKSMVADFLLGRLDEHALMSAANASDPMKNRALLCEACYYRGIKCLLAGDEVRAKECFEQCLSTGMIYFTEYVLAREELAALR